MAVFPTYFIVPLASDPINDMLEAFVSLESVID